MQCFSLTEGMRSTCRLREAIADRQNGRQNYADPIRAREVAHRHQIVEDNFLGHGSMQAGDIIEPSLNDDCRGMESNHILAKADQHLICCLAGDAAIEPLL